jgi:hypothetical protein
MPERPNVDSDFYDAALGRDPYFVAVERPERGVPAAREMVLTTSFNNPEMRAWAAKAQQIDVVDYELVVLHAPCGPAPESFARQLRAPSRHTPNIAREGLVDGRWAFVLEDATWVLAAMGYVDHVRALLARTRPPRLGIPDDVSQLLFLARPRGTRSPCRVVRGELTCSGAVPLRVEREGLEWFVFATKTDGTYVTHAHYMSEDAVEKAPNPSTPENTLDAFQHGAELYLQGR